MNIIKLNSGTNINPTILDKKFKENDFVVLESGFYILKNDVVIDQVINTSQVKEMWGSSQVNVM